MIPLSEIPTCELIDELKGREGVREFRVLPDETFAVSVSPALTLEYHTAGDGPALILVVID